MGISTNYNQTQLQQLEQERAMLLQQQQQMLLQAQYEQEQQDIHSQYQTESGTSQLVSWGSNNSSTDGNDDGKIGFWSGVGHFIKGATVGFVRSALGFEKDGSWSFGKALKNLAIGAAIGVATVATGGAALAVVGAVGAVTTAYGAAKAGVTVANAKTDKEAKDACEEMGENVTGFALSATAMKAGVSKMHATEAAAGRYNGLKGYKNVAVDLAQDGRQALSNVRNSFKDGTVIEDVTALGNKAWGNLQAAYGKGSAQNTVNDRINEINKKIEDLKAKMEKEGTSTADKAGFNKEIKALEAQRQAYTDASRVGSVEEAQARITEAEGNISKLEQLKAQETSPARQQVYQRQIDAAQSQLKTYKEVVNQRITAARNGQGGIELPKSERSSYIQEIKDLRTKLTEAEKALAEAKKVVSNGDTSAAAKAAVEAAQQRVNGLNADLSTNRMLASVTNGRDYIGGVRQAVRGYNRTLPEYGTIGGQKILGHTVVPKVNITTAAAAPFMQGSEEQEQYNPYIQYGYAV